MIARFTPQTLAVCTLIALFILGSCRNRPIGTFQDQESLVSPDYSQNEAWAALPWTKDHADLLPDSSLTDRQQDAEVDVFFIHPTTYGYRKGFTGWNGSINSEKLNQRTDTSTIMYQASIFNGVGRVFAPRYRQAHLHAYYAYTKEKRKSDAIGAFKLAYKDVATAFSYYLQNHNNGRPIVIAAHSQGTTHSILLLKQFFDGKLLQKQLVAAYLVGMPVAKDTFNTISVCENPTQTGCFCSWRTIKRNKKLDWNGGPNVVVTNPLSWEIGTTYVSANKNQGGVMRNFYTIVPDATDAQITDDGFLWATKPRFPLSFFWRTKNFHVADYNFYYLNVRRNAQDRVKAFLIQNE